MVRKNILLTSILSVCITSSAFASADGDIPGLPSGMFGSTSETEQKIVVKPKADVAEKPDVAQTDSEGDLDLAPMREKIKSYLEKEVKERKAIVEKQIVEQKKEKTGIIEKTPIVDANNSDSDSEDNKADGKSNEVVLLEPTVTKKYKIPEGSIQAIADKNGVYRIDGGKGKTHLVEVSKGLFNKIKTPFMSPKILTTSKLKVMFKGKDIFVATGSEKVLGVWVYDEENPAHSVSIALLPRPTSPVTMSIDLSEEELYGDTKTPMPASTELKATDIPMDSQVSENTAFEELVVDLVSVMVNNGEYPKGFDVVNYNNPVSGSVCQHPEIKGKLKQTLKGEMFDIDVISIKNFSAYPARIEEKRCYAKDVVAVSVNPVEYLASGQVGELLVVKMSNEYMNKVTPKRELRPTIKDGEW